MLKMEVCACKSLGYVQAKKAEKICMYFQTTTPHNQNYVKVRDFSTYSNETEISIRFFFKPTMIISHSVSNCLEI